MSRLALVGAALAGGWLLAAFPLLLLGVYRATVAVPVAGAVAAAATVAVWRWTAPGPGEGRTRSELVPLVATLLVVAAFTGLVWVTHSSQVIVRRDPAAYALNAEWLAQAGRLPIPADGDVFGHVPQVAVSSPAYYAADHLHNVVPQFLTGLPLLLTPAGWAGGLDGILHANAVIGGLALLAAAALAAAVAGPWAAPAAAAVLAAIFPVLHAARTTLAEPAAMLFFLAGLLAILLALRRQDSQATARGLRLLATGGLLLGLSSLVRLDAYADLLPMAPWLAVVALRRGSRTAGAVAGGLAVGIAYGVVDGLWVTRPYLGEARAQLIAVGVAWVLVTAPCVWWLRGARRRRHPDRSGDRVFERLSARLSGSVLHRRLPEIAAGAVAAAAVALAVRPLVQTVRPPGYRGAPAVEAMQRHQGLAVDPNRTYAEHSLQWLAAWAGIPFVIAAVLGLALLTRAALRDDHTGGRTLLVLVTGASTLRVLWDPGIMPDHPWADRRLVPVVYPLLTIAAVWLVERLVAAARRHVGEGVRRRVVVPGVRVASIGALGVLPLLATIPLAGAGTQLGEPAALDRLCAALPSDAAVLVVGYRSSEQLPGATRIRCGVPVASMGDPDRASLQRVSAAVRAHGRQLTVVSREPDLLLGLGLRPRHLLTLVTTEDARLLTVRPHTTQPLVIPLWIADVAGSATINGD